MSNLQSHGAGLVLFVPNAARYPAPMVYLGLDLGQRRDHSALAVVQLGWIACGRCPQTFAYRFQPELVIRSLERFPLGTCYDGLHDVILARIDSIDSAVPEMQLIIDAGGPGPPVVDRLRKSAPASLRIRPVIITGGKAENRLPGGYTGIPRRSLVSTILLAIGAKSLRCPQGIKNWSEFLKELVGLKPETTQTAAHDSHDDLVMAVALAVHSAVRDTPELLPASGLLGSDDPEKQKVQFGFVGKRLF